MKGKIFAVILLITLMFIFCAISASATGEDIDTGTEEGIGTAVNDSTSIGAADDTDRDGTEEEGRPGGEASDNIFDMLLDGILENADSLFAALAFIGSAFIALAYKKGLLPIIKGSLSALTSAVVTLKEETVSGMESTSTQALLIKEKFESTEKIFSAITDRLDTLGNELSKLDLERERSEAMRSIMSAQVDMLYEIFMSSSLPQYQKDAVGERISEMKKALGTGADENE